MWSGEGLHGGSESQKHDPLPPYWNNSSIQEDMTIIKNAYNVIFLYVYILFDVTFNLVIALSSILYVCLDCEMWAMYVPSLVIPWRRSWFGMSETCWDCFICFFFFYDRHVLGCMNYSNMGDPVFLALSELPCGFLVFHMEILRFIHFIYFCTNKRKKKKVYSFPTDKCVVYSKLRLGSQWGISSF